jgi:N-acetylglucosamine-1-phosphodiester alpha-N-acetylglucosaminidase
VVAGLSLMVVGTAVGNRLEAPAALSWTGMTTTDVDSVPLPPASPGAPLSVSRWNGTVRSTGRAYTGYLMWAPDPRALSFEVYQKDCTNLYNVSLTAAEYSCAWATNAGFFSWTSTDKCMGNLVTNGTVVQLPALPTINLGVNATDVVLGFIDASSIASFRFSQLIQGVGWLVRDGESYVNRSADLNATSYFVLEYAPRTALGLDAKGRLGSFVVDGIEDDAQGLNLFEVADVLLQYGFVQAINLDGGGSTQAVYHGQIYDRPTCNDTPSLCERPVTSAVCVRE